MIEIFDIFLNAPTELQCIILFGIVAVIWRVFNERI